MRPPKLIKPYVTTFCRSITAAHSPQYIQTTPTPGAPLNECFRVVADRVAREGGESLLGWAIWEWPKVLLEAELHCVWKRPDGELADIAGRSLPIPRILFLPDPAIRHTGRQIDNRRKALCNDPQIKRFIELSGSIFRETNKGALADFYGELTEADLPPHVVRQLKERHTLTLGLIRRYGQRTTE